MYVCPSTLFHTYIFHVEKWHFNLQAKLMAGLVFIFVNSQKQFHLRWKLFYFYVSWFKLKYVDKTISNRDFAWRIHSYSYIRIHICNGDFICKDHRKCHLIVINQQSKRHWNCLGLSNVEYEMFLLSPEVSVYHIIQQLSAGLNQALILHVGVSIPYLFPHVTSFCNHEISISLGVYIRVPFLTRMSSKE